MEHDVNDIKLKVRIPKCVNWVTYMDEINDEVVEGFNDCEDGIATAFVDGFHGS